MNYFSVVEDRYWTSIGDKDGSGPSHQVRSELADGSIEQILNQKVYCLSSILTDIQREIDQRKTLSRSVSQRIYAHYFYIKSKVFELAQWPVNGPKAIEQRRSNLENTLDTLLNEARREQVQCSQDVTHLKRDFWRWFREYCDLVHRAGMISGK